MQLAYYQPSHSCRLLVRQYEQVQAQGENISVIDRHIPSGYASIVFNSSGHASIHEACCIQLPSHFIVFPLFRAVRIGVYENLDSFIVTCQASILSNLLSLNLSACRDRYYCQFDDEELVALSRLFHELMRADERQKSIEDYFLKLGLESYHPDEVDGLYQLIMSGKGTQPIADVIERFDRSPRYFRTHFNQRIGVNAKMLARIVRVNHLWSMILNDRAVDFQDMVFEGGYFDQAHLIHDFEQLVGEKPSSFFRRNLCHVQLISGKL